MTFINTILVFLSFLSSLKPFLGMFFLLIGAGYFFYGLRWAGELDLFIGTILMVFATYLLELI